MIDDGIQVNYEAIHHYLTLALNNLPLSTGLTLKASNNLDEIGSISIANLPYIILTSGTIKRNDWHAFETQNSLQVIGHLKVSQDGEFDRYQVLRSVIDDLDLQLAKVRGLPVLEDGSLHIYKDDITPELIAKNELSYLANLGGPRIINVSVHNTPEQPFASADITIEVDYITDFSPDQPLPRAKQVLFGFSQMRNGEIVDTKTTSPSSDVVMPGNTLIGIQVIPYQVALTVNQTLNCLTAQILLDGSRYDITSAATYGSADPTIATVSNTGTITALLAGNTTITATYNGISQSIPVVVS